MSTSNITNLKKQLRELTNELSGQTEKTPDELYAELCQTNHTKSAQTIIADAPFVSQHAASKSAFEALVESTPSAAVAAEPKGRAAQAVAQASKARKDTKRNAFLRLQTVRPKFKIFAPTTEQKAQDTKNWKVARPLLAKLQQAIDEGNELGIAYAYAPARQPVKNLAKGLLRDYEEVLSEVIPAFSVVQIQKFDKPFQEIEEAEKAAREPQLPDLSVLNFNDISDAFARPWGRTAPAGEEEL